jgi:site-specific DNA recombinase
MPEYQLPPSTLPPGSIVDTYLRDSGGENQDRSVQRQLEAIKLYCAQYGLTLRHVYADAAKSGGTTAGRDEFDRLITSTRAPEERPAGLLLWNYARFARDLDDSTYYKALLRSKRGIVIHSLTDPIPEGPYARFVEILIDISNEEKRRQTAIDTADGLRHIVTQGAVPGTPPRGFTREPIVTINPRTGQERTNHRWVPDADFKARILKAFEMRSASLSLAEIEKECRLFTSISSYSSFWRNRLYYGTLVFGGMTVENYCEPIVPRELWEQVQAVQDRYGKRRHVKANSPDHPRRVKSNFLLSGIARCGRCGSPLYGGTSLVKGKYKYQSYLCTLAYRKRGACTKDRIPRHALESAVITALTEVILQPQNLTEALTVLTEQQSSETQIHEDRLRGLRSQLADVRRQLTNITNAIADAGGSTTLLARLHSLEQQQSDLLTDIVTAEAQVPAAIPQASQVALEHSLQRITATLHGKDEEAKRTTLRGLLAYVDVERRDKNLLITIYYYLPTEGDPESNPPPDPHDAGDDEDGPSRKYAPTIRTPPGAPEFQIKKESPQGDSFLISQSIAVTAG